MVKRVLKPRTASSLSRYGLTVEEWQKLLDKQGGVCFICHRGGKIRHLSVDHDRTIEKETGRLVVRGLLCDKCNHRGVGAFEWDDDVIRRAISYLQRILRLRARYLAGTMDNTEN